MKQAFSLTPRPLSVTFPGARLSVQVPHQIPVHLTVQVTLATMEGIERHKHLALKTTALNTAVQVKSRDMMTDERTKVNFRHSHIRNNTERRGTVTKIHLEKINREAMATGVTISMIKASPHSHIKKASADIIATVMKLNLKNIS